MEHLNRLCKTDFKDMGANKTKEAILRTSKALSKTSAIVDNADDITTVKAPSQQLQAFPGTEISGTQFKQHL